LPDLPSGLLTRLGPPRRSAIRDTQYDELLMSGIDREIAREEVREHVSHTLAAWRSSNEKDVAAAQRP
jgi:hypothetical protein